MPVYRSYEKGDVECVRKGTTHEDYGFSCDVSEREWSDFTGQVADAIRFLTVHAAELHALVTQHQVNDMRLDFPVESRLTQSVVAQFDYLPPELIKLCAERGIGIEISHYAPGGKENCEPSAVPDGGPAMPSASSGVTEGPPSGS